MHRTQSQFKNEFDNEPHQAAGMKRVDDMAAKIPNVGYMGLAVGSMLLSASLVLLKKKELGNFVGLWAPSLLIIGVYNKLVKMQHNLDSSKV